MNSAIKPELELRRTEHAAPCPVCGVELNGAATPLDSIVVCAYCCAALLWDGTFSCLTPEQIEQLPEGDRLRLEAVLEAQRACVAARILH